MLLIIKGISGLEALLTGGVMVLFLLLAGVWLTAKTRCFQVRGLRFIAKNTVGTLLSRSDRARDGNLSPFQAVTTALAGTMGVGNIAGVSTALVAGGPGAIFWMWMGAFFGMMTKYAEIFLAVKHRRRDSQGRYQGGPMYYMEDLTGGRGLASLFAAACAASALGIGNMAQVNSVSAALGEAFSIPPWVSGAVVAAAVSLVIFGGVQRIGRVTEAVIPFISILYLFCAGTCLYLHRSALPGALAGIVREAFALRPALGGLGGWGISRAVAMGLSRGVFTNEAGLGSAPIAHASADCESPAHQGVWGIFEVFLDTIVVCTVTALVVLVAGEGKLLQSGLDGASLTAAAFAGTFGRFGGRFLAVSLVFFAVAAMLGWCFYGESALSYLTRGSKKALVGYRLLFLACIMVGAVAELAAVWRLSDCLNALMALPNLAALFLLRGEVQTPSVPDRQNKRKKTLSGQASTRRQFPGGMV